MTYTAIVCIKLALYRKLRSELAGQLIGDRERARLLVFRQRIQRVNQLLIQADRRSKARPGINWATFQPIMG